MSHVTVHIERLVLTGYEARDRHAVADAVQVELVRLLASDAAVTRLTGLAAAPPPRVAMTVDHDTKPAALGRAVARAIAGENGR